MILGKCAVYVFFILSIGAMAGRAVPGLEGYGPLLRCFGGFFLGCCIAGFVKETSLRLPAWSPVVALAALGVLLVFKPTARGPADLVIYLVSWLTSLVVERPLRNLSRNMATLARPGVAVPV